MNVSDEIREKFASLSSLNNGFLELISLPSQYPAYIYVDQTGYSVAVRCDKDLKVKEYFAGAMFFSENRLINGEEVWFLVLNTQNSFLRNEFAAVCAEFVNPGENGLLREKLIKNPLAWWNNWKELMGNTSCEKMVYSVIAEMVILSKLYESDKSLLWAAVEAGSHDIEGDSVSYEVKSSLKRYDTLVTISGQFQLLNQKPLYLMFCRMEQSKEGVSIDDMVEKLIKQGYDQYLLESQLFRMGYEKNMNDRKRKYKFHEIRKISVDDDFPKIVPESFKGDKLPAYIKQITYTLDLSTYPYENMSIK